MSGAPRDTNRPVSALTVALLPVLLDVDRPPEQALARACALIADHVGSPVAVYLAGPDHVGHLVTATDTDFPVVVDRGVGVNVELPGRHGGWLAVLGDSVEVVPLTARAAVARLLAELAAERDIEIRDGFADHSARAVTRLLEQVGVAETVDEAGQALARVVSEAFATERAAVHLLDSYGRIRHVIALGIPAEIRHELQSRLLGRLAGPSDGYRHSEFEGGPVLVDDREQSVVRVGGLVHTMQLRSYVAMPLLSTAGPIGMVVCGDVTTGRVWSEEDHSMAVEIARTAALTIDNVRLRQSEQQHQIEFAHQAFHDPLTGLPNRSLFADRANESLSAAREFDGRVAILRVDLDGFKRVNDHHGHGVGDELLRITAARMTRSLRDGDVVARIGGDEFAVLVNDPPTIDSDLAVIARRLTMRLSQPCTIDGETVRVDASVGVALFPDHAADLEELLECADLAMCRSKQVSHQPEVYSC